MVCNVRMALRLDPETGMITIRGYGDDSKVISLRLVSSGLILHREQIKIYLASSIHWESIIGELVTEQIWLKDRCAMAIFSLDCG